MAQHSTNTNQTPGMVSPPPGGTKVAVAVAQQIVEDIRRQGLGPGSRLPTETQMLATYGVARGTLRESLRFLEINGIITMRQGPRGGPVVALPAGRNFAGVLGLFLEIIGARFESIIEVRRALEPIIAARAALAMTQPLLEGLRESARSMEAFAERQDESFFEENRRFHELIADASGDPLYALLISSLHFITDGKMVGVAYTPKRRRAIARAHRLIVDALELRDPEAASAAMTSHMDEFFEYVARHYPEMLTSPLRWRHVAP